MLVAVALSVVVHVPLLAGLYELFDEEHTLESPEIDVDGDFSLTLADEEPDETRDDDEERDGQFISYEPPDEEREPDEARFFDQYESRADEEMAPQEPGPEVEAPPGEPSDEEASAEPREADDRREREPQEPERDADEETPEPDDDRSEEETEAAERPDDAAEGDQTEKLDEDPSAQGLIEQGDAADDKEKAPDEESVDPSELFPSSEDAARAAGGGEPDYLEDVDEGDETLLNRKESKYWSFMQRLKRQVAREWSPGEAFRRHDPDGDRYGVEDRFTKLRITLEEDGSMRSVYVGEPSGAKFYDDEAVRAVRDAAPFPNPPDGMKNRDGLVDFTFGFMLDVERGGGPAIRLRRR